MKKRMVAMVIAASMVIGIMSGCGSGNSNPTQGTSAASGTSEKTETTAGGDSAETSAQVTEAADEEIPTIVYYNNSGGINYNDGVATDPDYYKRMQDYIIEQIGVKVEVIIPPQDNAAEKLGLLLAGGDQLDFWWGNWRDYYEDGIIIPINEYLEMPEAKSLYEDWDENHYDGWKRMTDLNGNIWGIPRLCKGATYPVYVRNDWLELLGMDMPQTLDDLNKYLYAIKDLDPYGNGETIPLVLQGGANPMDGAVYCFGGGFLDPVGRWLDEADGKVKPDYLQAGYKDLVDQVRQWYEDGIIHIEYMGNNNTIRREQITSGRVAATACWYSDVTITDEGLSANVPDWDVTERGDYIFGMNHNGLIGPNGKKMEIFSNGNSTQALMISSKCKHPEAVMKFIEWANEFENSITIQRGFEGEGWEYSDKENAKEMHIINVLNDKDYVYCMDFWIPNQREASVTDFYASGVQNMHNKYLQEYYSEYSRGSDQDFEWSVAWDSAAMSEACPFLGDINTYRNEQFAKFINGTRSMDTWDQFIEECYDMGLDAYIEESTRQYNNWLNSR